MTDQELMELMLRFDPQAKRIPPGVRAIADAVLAEAQKQIRKEQLYYSQQFARIKELEAEAAEKQVEIEGLQAAARHWNDKANQFSEEVEALKARIATLEQQRQQDTAIQLLRDLAHAMNTAFISSWQTTAGWQQQLDAANAYLEEPHHD